MVRVDAHFFFISGEGKLATVEWLQFMMALQIRPAPHAAVDDVRQTFSVGHLKSSVQASWDGDTLCHGVWLREGLLQLFKGSLLFLELFDERIDGFFCPFIVLISLFPAQQALHGWRRKREQCRHRVYSFNRTSRLDCLTKQYRLDIDFNAQTLT